MIEINRKTQIKLILKENNIRYGLLGETLGITRPYLLSALNRRHYDISVELFNEFKSGIDKIINKEVNSRDFDEVIEFNEIDQKNCAELRFFLKSNKLKLEEAGKLIGLTKTNFSRYLYRNRGDIFAEKKDEIISTIKEKLNL